MLAASGFRTTIAEAAQVNNTLTNSGLSLTVTTSGKISAGSVTNDGVVTMSGNASSVGTAVTITLNPSLTASGVVTWNCTATSTQHKYVPAECRKTV